MRHTNDSITARSVSGSRSSGAIRMGAIFSPPRSLFEFDRQLALVLHVS
jgi:hypothetical protein